MMAVVMIMLTSRRMASLQVAQYVTGQVLRALHMPRDSSRELHIIFAHKNVVMMMMTTRLMMASVMMMMTMAVVTL